MLAVSVEHVEHCTDPHVLNYTSWQTLPGINVLLVDEFGVVEDSAGDSLRGSPKHWLTVPANHQPFSVRLQLNGPCPLWEVVNFKLKVQGVHSFFVKVGDQTSDNVQVLCIGATTVDTGPQLLGWGQQHIVPQLLGRSFQKARNFTASSHQNA